MSTYKKLLTSDKSIIPFNANRSFTLTNPVTSGSSQWSITSTNDLKPLVQTFYYSSASLHTFSSASTDVSNSLNYHQLDHLYYKNYKTDISNKFGDVNFISNERELYDEVNVISIPSGLFGLKIKDGTFNFSGSNGSGYLPPVSQSRINEISRPIVELIDHKGNLIISGTNLADHSTDIREKVFFMGPIKGFKQYDLNSQFYKETEIPEDLHQYYSKKNVIDDSFYLNNLHYKNITFTKETVSPELCLNRSFDDLTLSGSKRIKGWTHISYSGSLEHQDSASAFTGQVSLTAGTATSMTQISTTNSPLERGKCYEVIVDIHSFTSSINPADPTPYNSSININLGNPYPRIVNQDDYSSGIGSQHNSEDIGQFPSGQYKHKFINDRPRSTSGVSLMDSGRSLNDLRVYIWDGSDSSGENNDTQMILNGISCREVVKMPVANFTGNTGEELVSIPNLRDVGTFNNAGTNVDNFVQNGTLDTFEPTKRGMHLINNANGNWSFALQDIGIEEGKHYEYCVTVTKGPTATTSLLFQQDTNTTIKQVGEAFNVPGKPITYKGTFIGTPTGGAGTHNGRILFKTGNANAILDHYISHCSVKEIHTNLNEPTEYSSIVAPHNETYNFNTGEDFTISMYVHPKLPDVGASDMYLVSKSTTKSDIQSTVDYLNINTTGSSQLNNAFSKPQFPFEIYIDKGSNNETSKNLTFRRSDGNIISTISASIDNNMLSHVVCMRSGSQMEIWVEGEKVASGSDSTFKQTSNKANLYIGSKGERSSFFSGSMSNLMIFNQSRTSTQIENLRQTINGSPYVGNLFHSQGIATITHPKYHKVAKASYQKTYNTSSPFSTQDHPINYLENNLDFEFNFKNIHPIFENEYQCTVQADEYNYTNNVSIRKHTSDQHPTLANFATGSLWKPYVTTIGLYDENNELLVVGKLGQPIRMSDETDTTFVLRWDT
jgi:hypothetical protein